VRLAFYIAEGSPEIFHDGKITTLRATSGRPGYINDPTKTDLAMHGAIPVGSYFMLPSELDDPDPWYDVVRNEFLGDWGDWRISLHPELESNTFGRHGFFLHGGARPGSAGCIDIGGGVSGNAQTDFLKEFIRNHGAKISLFVKEYRFFYWDGLPGKYQRVRRWYA
jgi:hypothetical protein